MSFKSALRLGPLSIEQKIRATNKRARQSKEDFKEEKPSNLDKDDIETSANETTKNVLVVMHSWNFDHDLQLLID